MKLARQNAKTRVHTLMQNFPVVAIIGPRQVGKTTLAREIAKDFDGEVSMFDLEDPSDLARLQDAGLTLKPLRGLVIIDEIQLRPDLFSLLRPLADREELPCRFLILGSASPELMTGSAQSLAGRIAYFELESLNLAEVGEDKMEDLWVRGGFPRSFLSSNMAMSYERREQFITTFLERDIPQLGINVPARLMRRFWTMLAHYHGQTLNASELGRSLNVTDKTVRSYLDILVSTFVVRELQPYFVNVSKRQVKSPKIYIRDTGILHTLLGLGTKVAVERHPKLGASWESFAMNQVIAQKAARAHECFFWGTHSGAELDLLIVRGEERLGYEFKRTESPRTTKSMHSAIQTLELTSMCVVHAGPKSFQMTESIDALSIHDIF